VKKTVGPHPDAPRYALTLIARTLGASELQTVSEILAAHGANIERIYRLSEGGLTSVEFAISLRGEDAPLKRALLAAAGQGAFDCALQRETLRYSWRRARGPSLPVAARHAPWSASPRDARAGLRT